MIKKLEIESTPVLYLDFSDKKKDEKEKNSNLNLGFADNLFINSELNKKNKTEEDSLKKLQNEVNIFYYHYIIIIILCP